MIGADDRLLRQQIAEMGVRIIQLMAGRHILPTDQMINAIVERRRQIAFENTADKRDWGVSVRFDEKMVRDEAVADLAVALPLIGILP